MRSLELDCIELSVHIERRKGRLAGLCVVTSTSQEALDRARLARERREAEQRKRLDELRAHAAAAQAQREKRDEERRRRQAEQRAKDDERRVQLYWQPLTAKWADKPPFMKELDDNDVMIPLNIPTAPIQGHLSQKA
ncbi:hypothetical protein HF086_008867 [Spodoptera exigua]|uniref:Uncharacterized protein n=1 Tax=Spodoptera exigua TaxID=7107 RepID=A0A922SC24_SPOEX|nr:hypothetical protein HF086_008867 [Spodoptera exigua]